MNSHVGLSGWKMDLCFVYWASPPVRMWAIWEQRLHFLPAFLLNRQGSKGCWHRADRWMSEYMNMDPTRVKRARTWTHLFVILRLRLLTIALTETRTEPVARKKPSLTMSQDTKLLETTLGDHSAWLSSISEGQQPWLMSAPRQARFLPKI